MPVSPHILMSADALGGVWPYSLDLAGALRAHGLGVTLAVLGPAPAPERAAAAAAATGARILPTGLPLDWTAGRPEEVRGAAAALARLAGAIRADLVHLHAPALALADFPVPVVAVCHSCVATWWEACGAEPMPADLAWRAHLAAEGCRAADALLAPTAAFAAATARAYGLARAPRVVRNGRDRPVSPPQEEPAAHAFTAGRLWDGAKNAAALGRMAARLPCPVLAAGPVAGPNGARVDLAHLRLLGRLDEAGIAAQLAARPVFVSLARYEPFGLAVLEAAGAGCALVLSDIPSFRELWDGAARFVEAEDDAAAAGAVAGLMADPARRAALGEAARTRAARYGVAAMAEGVLAVFRGLLDASGDAGGSRVLPPPSAGRGVGEPAAGYEGEPPRAPSPVRERVGVRDENSPEGAGGRRGTAVPCPKSSGPLTRLSAKADLSRTGEGTRASSGIPRSVPMTERGDLSYATALSAEGGGSARGGVASVLERGGAA